MGENQRCKKRTFDNFFSLLNLYMYLLSVQYLSRASLWINHPELLYFFIDVSQSLEILFWKQCTNNIKTKIITSVLIHVTYKSTIIQFLCFLFFPIVLLWTEKQLETNCSSQPTTLHFSLYYSTPWPLIVTSNFSLQCHPWITHFSHKNIGNDHQLLLNKFSLLAPWKICTEQ